MVPPFFGVYIPSPDPPRGLPRDPPPRLGCASVAARDELIRYLDELLDAASFEDYGPNGLQVPGAEQVQTVATGVSAHRELFERAAAAGAELVLCHHGILWDGQPRTVTPQLKERLGALFAPTCRWPPTTCRWTRTPRWATTR